MKKITVSYIFFFFSRIYPDNETNTETEYTYTHTERKKLYDQFYIKFGLRIKKSKKKDKKKQRKEKWLFFKTFFFIFITLLYVGCTRKKYEIHCMGSKNSVRDEMRYLWDKCHIYYAMNG